MKLEYAISFDEFRSIHAPFAAKAGRNVGFRAVLVVCIAIALLGVVTGAQGLGLGVGVFFVGLGAVSALVAYFFDRRSIDKAQQKYEDSIRKAYEQIHCPDRRELEVNENGFTTTLPLWLGDSAMV